MSDSPPNPALTPAERLRLLQLQTRDAMASRIVKASEGAAEEGLEVSAEPVSDSAPQTSDVPWRLLPADVTLHRWQAECLDLWMTQGRGTVKVATGAGKTLFALAVAERLHNERENDLRVVIVVPTIPLMHQWHEDLRRGNVPASALGLMGGGQDTIDPAQTRIAICVINSARDRLPRLVQQADWASRLLLVVDECHRANAEESRRVFECHPRYVLGLSATPETESDDVDMPSDAAYAESPVGQALGRSSMSTHSGERSRTVCSPPSRCGMSASR